MMDTQDQNQNNYNGPKHGGRVWGGLFLLIIGAVFLLRELDYPFFPAWFFSWPMIVIAVAIFTGIRHGFRGTSWLVLLIVGGTFLIGKLNSTWDLHRFMVPVIIIAIGLMLVLRPRRAWGSGWDGGCGPRDRWSQNQQRRKERWERRHQQFSDSWKTPSDTGTNPNSNATTDTGPGPDPDTGPQQNTFSQSDNYKEDYIDSTSVLGGIRKVILSKNFKGGEATSFMGGIELDLTQADIAGTVVLELHAVLGGVKLIVPPHWNVKSEVTAVLGGIDDKRQVQSVTFNPNKVLILKGTAFMGGIEIRNY